MNTVPLTLKQANTLVADLHRHHKPVHAHRFSIGAVKRGEIVGAAIVARPVAHATPQYEVAEVVRLVTDGTKNAASHLYGATARVAKAMGFWKIQTFILEDEPGTSLIAAGWEFDGWTDGGDELADTAVEPEYAHNRAKRLLWEVTDLTQAIEAIYALTPIPAEEVED